ncbi:peptidoglycan DD-metalloendopeptidase family protein [Conexibacter sp. JD483]|uniref:murein hydrolase activator EnvC family protein n=1 Tax=unclassified Conexibacter TaxID=2627773 RepID=UPI0027159E8B|nr:MULTISPECIES: peptidoglycan DD-metalloendopeptidase family protein [unclassified Conexibacter]MDO8189579.1 peptidoglycan DD-metalloendopeptidase family protein [Conexibacter sp. CPCC 205706]MDO8199272.1 peptidoglycan DD-metalloendopeptidase family protein [Conexibacter sp. CPCC 205762]MDR9373072.1 peptidoglycan DD-metalloendopeptidase family protein [Conexibacter sp. JD483]
MRLRLLLVTLLLPLVVWVMLPVVSGADSQDDVDRLQGRIEQKQGQLDQVRGRARVLTSDITALTKRIDSLQGNVDVLQSRQDQIQGQLDDKRRELATTQEDLRDVRARLARLRTRLDSARRTLAARLVELYKSDEPDMVSVVLSSDGFAELLENGAYLQRIGEQDKTIITAVRDAKAEAATETRRLDTLERRQQSIADEIYQRRNEVARARIAVERKRDAIDRVRGDRRALLGTVRERAGHLNEDIRGLQAQQDKIQKRIQAAQNPSSTATSGGQVAGNGRFIWPVNGPITSPFCEARSWENCHPGIDIGVGEGTPIHAGGSGTVIMAGYNGGYGNYTCIDHGGGVSTCYAHQSVIQVSVGQHVNQGQVIGLSGNTGFSFGPHLHFEVRINGAVTQPLNYLG